MSDALNVFNKYIVWLKKSLTWLWDDFHMSFAWVSHDFQVSLTWVSRESHMSLHFRVRLIFAGFMTHRTDSSNNCLRPLCVNAEHSIYFWARILDAIFIPCSLLMKVCPFCARDCKVSLSSLKSVLVPTRIIGTSLQWCLISGTHFTNTFSNYKLITW